MKKILLIFLFVLTMYLPALAAVSSKDSLYRIERERAIELDSILRVRAPEFFEWEKIQEDTRCFTDRTGTISRNQSSICF